MSSIASCLSTLSPENKIHFFLQTISPDAIQRVKCIFEDAVAFLEGKALSPTIKGGVILKSSDERKVMGLASIYLDIHKGGIDELYQLYHQLSGFRTIEACKPIPGNDCYHYIFQHEAWYQPILNIGPTTGDMIQFLIRQGYRIASAPEVGRIVIYSKDDRPQHYGKVVRLEADGTPIIRSKFGMQHINEHLLELVPYEYGHEVVFLFLVK